MELPLGKKFVSNSDKFNGLTAVQSRPESHTFTIHFMRLPTNQDGYKIY